MEVKNNLKTRTDDAATELSWELFQVLKSAVYDSSGLYLQDTRFDEVEKLLQAIYPATTHSNLGFLVHELVSQNALSSNYQRFLKKLAENQSDFFKYPEQDKILSDLLLPVWDNQAEKAEKFRILFAGCGNGKGLYSALIELHDSKPELFKKGRLEVTGLDFDSEMVEKAARGFWGASELKALPVEIKEKYFIFYQNGARILPEISSVVSFLQANLLNVDEMTALGRFNAVFCRNVLIFYNKDIRKQIIKILEDVLVEGGYLFLAPFESLHGLPHGFTPVHFSRVFGYQKITKK